MKITLEKYLQKKEQRNEATEEMRILCPHCRKSIKACFCSCLRPFSTHFHFCILMHPKEAKKEKVGTGRNAHLLLKNSQIIVGINFNDDPLVKDLLNSNRFHPMLLYPGEQAHDISQHPLEEHFAEGKIPLVFVIDATWTEAKTMMRESSLLHALPRISFSRELTSNFRIKHQPVKGCLSTAESLHTLLDCLEQWGHENLGNQHHALLEAQERMVQFQIDCARDPSLKKYGRGHYSLAVERPQAKRWEQRQLLFEEKNY